MPRFGFLLTALVAPLLLTACYPVQQPAPVVPPQEVYLLRTVEVEPRVQTVSVPSVERRWHSFVTARVDVMIRKGPGKSYQGCGHLPKGRSADLIECQGDWCKIRYNGQEGWSHSRYLNFHSNEIQSHRPAQQVVDPGYSVNYVVPMQSGASSCAPNAIYCVWRPTGYQATGQSAPVVNWVPRPPLPQGAWWERP